MMDLARMTMLAPQWFEGLVKKEMAIPMHMAGMAKDVYQHPSKLMTPRKVLMNGNETAARGIARGLLAMVVMTQLANMLTRGKPTWENKEKEHKWDADVFGVWVSPLSVYNELLHDFIRLNQSKDKTWDAIKQIGENKLGFYGRVGMVLATDKTPAGQYISTTGGMAKEAASQLIPTPISFGKLGKTAGYTVAPKAMNAARSLPLVGGAFSPNEPGQALRQFIATIGIKGQVARQPIDSIQKMASNFAQKSGLRPDSVQLVPTDEPSYAKLRHALFVGDKAGAAKMLQALRQSRASQPDFDNRLVAAMSNWSRRPFTGSYAGESRFVDSLDADDRELYATAQKQRMDFFNQFIQWYLQQPH